MPAARGQTASYRKGESTVNVRREEGNDQTKMVSTSTATESECPDEKEAADAAKRASAAANKALFKYRLVRPGTFKTENHFYPRVINSQIHPTVRFFMGLSQERIVERYCHMHPKVDRNVLMEVVKFKSEHFHWAGCDLMHTVNNAGEKKMVSGGWWWW
jgi:hypothetical protein